MIHVMNYNYKDSIHCVLNVKTSKDICYTCNTDDTYNKEQGRSTFEAKSRNEVFAILVDTSVTKFDLIFLE